VDEGYAYSFLAILHAVTVILTLLWLPFGKLFHVFQRPAQLGVSFYKDAGKRTEQAKCARCGRAFASLAMVGDLIPVEVAGRMDDERFERVWEISQRGARAERSFSGSPGLALDQQG
jgi:hypothetical protein